MLLWLHRRPSRKSRRVLPLAAASMLLQSYGQPASEENVALRRAARDYADVIKYRSHRYRGRPARLMLDMHDVRLGPVAFMVRDTLNKRDDGDPDNAPQILDEGSTWLPEGTPVHEITGFPTSSRLAAYRNGELRIYVASSLAD